MNTNHKLPDKLISVASFLNDHPEARNIQCNNSVMEWQYILDENPPEDPYEWFLDPDDVQWEATDQNPWCDRFYIHINLPKSPIEAFIIGAEMFNMCPDEMEICESDSRSEVWVYVWYD